MVSILPAGPKPVDTSGYGVVVRMPEYGGLIPRDATQWAQARGFQARNRGVGTELWNCLPKSFRTRSAFFDFFAPVNRTLMTLVMVGQMLTVISDPPHCTR